jgi:hypothetical protein
VKEDNVIQIFVAGLPDTPGWVKLSRKKQDALLEHTSHIQQNRQLQMLGEFGELMELYQVKQLLEGEEMQMRDYMTRVYPDRHYRTISRKMDAFNQLVSTIPAGVMKRLGSVQLDVLNRFERITTAALGDIRNAIKELPQLPANTDKDAEVYLETLDTKIAEHRRLKRKGKPLQKDEREAAKMATNAVLHYLKACGLKTSAEKRKFLTRVMGWVMQAQAVSGTLRAGRIPIPDGILIRRGRPKGTGKKQRLRQEAA